MQVKERREPDRPGKGLFPWQMILFTAVLTIVGVCSLLLEKPDISEMEQRDRSAVSAQVKIRMPFSAAVCPKAAASACICPSSIICGRWEPNRLSMGEYQSKKLMMQRTVTPFSA